MGLEQFAALIEGDLFLQRDGAAFELFDDRLELGERLLERQSFDSECASLKIDHLLASFSLFARRETPL